MKSFLHEVKDACTTGWPEADLLMGQALSNNILVPIIGHWSYFLLLTLSLIHLPVTYHHGVGKPISQLQSKFFIKATCQD